MANTADAAAPEDAPSAEAPKSKKKLFIIAGAAVVLLAGAGGGGYFFLSSSSSEHSDAPAAAQAPKPAIFIDLQPMIVNLVSANDKPHYLRVTLALEISDETLRPRIEMLMPRIIDAFQTQLRQMRTGDLEGAAGLYRVKEELLRRINSRIYPAQVDGVLIKEFLLQPG